jgi:hypothetical protein
MRRVIIILTLFCVVMSHAQDYQVEDKELASLVEVVKTLRDPSKTNYNKAKQLLSADEKWTLMDELKDQNNAECLLTKKMKRFNLTTIINGVLTERYGKADVPGHYLNGEDSRFSYSLIEKGIKARKKVKYTFQGRVGKQDFVIIPCDSTSLFSIRLLKNDSPLKVVQKKSKDGGIYLHLDAKLKSTDKVTLEIENKSNSNVAIAILNHNTRK